MMKNSFKIFLLIITITTLLLFFNCPVNQGSSSGGGGGGKDSKTIIKNIWTWVSGSDTGNQTGVYGTKGTPSPTNIPGARVNSISWIDTSGNLWLFGGSGYDSNGYTDYLNDLWKYDGTNWTWMSGSDTGNQTGVYGTKGTPSATNIPGGRNNSISWIDTSGNLWLFGGDGYDSNGSTGRLNDLWKYDGTNWTWVSGSDTGNQTGVYGTKGTPSPTNIPGARTYSISWIDTSGNLWLFGGYGYDSNGDFGRLNDLWKYDGTNWTWMSGSNTGNQTGVYGTKGTPSATNIPGARINSISWIDTSGNLWLFGGYGNDSNGSTGRLNDLWKYDGTNWTWVSGGDTENQTGVYGTKGTPSPTNIPGARRYSISWIDTSGNLWLFGGYGYDSNGSAGRLNDLWKYDDTNWTWMSGSDTENQTGVYGTKGTPSPTNIPGARRYSISWIDTSGNLWLFGGSGSVEYLNDLWKFKPKP
jgi:N-acetylneuraminic acid mutarotase